MDYHLSQNEESNQYYYDQKYSSNFSSNSYLLDIREQIDTSNFYSPLFLPDIFAGMAVNHVQENSYAQTVSLVHKGLQLLWSSIPWRGSKKTRHLGGEIIRASKNFILPFFEVSLMFI